MEGLFYPRDEVPVKFMANVNALPRDKVIFSAFEGDRFAFYGACAPLPARPAARPTARPAPAACPVPPLPGVVARVGCVSVAGRCCGARGGAC